MGDEGREGDKGEREMRRREGKEEKERWGEERGIRRDCEEERKKGVRWKMREGRR